MDSRGGALVDSTSNGGVPRLTLSLDGSGIFSSSNVLLELPEDKRKVLEHRLINNPHAKNVETVVGFGENSRDKLYSSGIQAGENSRDKAFNAGDSRDRSYIPGAPIGSESSRDKTYVPGAPVTPVTPVKPCQNAAQAEAASRPCKVDHQVLNTGQSKVANLICGSREGAEGVAITAIHPEFSADVQAQTLYPPCNAAATHESEHFSAEELESSDEDSQGSASSNQGPNGTGFGGSTSGREDDDVLHSMERKRKLFAGDDASVGIIGGSGGRCESRTPPNVEKVPRKSKNQMKRSKTMTDPVLSEQHRAVDRSPPKNPRTITHFFAPTVHLASSCQASVDFTTGQSPAAVSTGTSSGSLAEKEKDLAKKETDLEGRERAVAEREKEVSRREALQSKFEEEALQRASALAKEERMQAEGLRKSHDQRVIDVMKNLLVTRAREERALVSARLCADTARVGRVSYIRSGLSVSEVWEDGSSWADLIKRGEELDAEEGRLERDRKAFAKRCKSGGAGTACGVGSGMQPPPLPSDEQAEQEEIYRLRMQKVRDKKKMLQDEKEKLEREKYSLIRELKRVQDQNRSKYNNYPLLNKRYLLLHLLGKGGFSEVYRAFDLLEMQEVACKIHELNSQWSDEKKSNYMKHATREYEIQKKLCHQRIVRLIDVFEVSSDGFCTVLEFCDGGDLEQILKAQRTLPEREARSIIMQVFAGLRYLNEQKHKVIHYDLKPANILFHSGEVKISDFGLSKIMDESDSGMMELTSQGAGTYWYLPPECFEVGHAPPKISSKVDVWSAGVIFFQMLFGVKPFGQGMSQEKMLIEQTITRSTTVHFPEGKDVPRVSDRAKEFVRRCLAYQQSDRPDVLAVFQDPYLRHTGRQASTAAT